jgi:hypothetical protein
MRKRLVIFIALSWPLPAMAQAGGLPPSVVLSGPLVEEIGRILTSRPYAEVAATIAKLQNEIQHQPKTSLPAAPGPAPETPAPSPEKN